MGGCLRAGNRLGPHGVSRPQHFQPSAYPPSECVSAGVPGGTPHGSAPTRNRIRLARAVGIAADVLQIAIFPLFTEGFISPLDDGLDLLVAVVVTLLVGWHIAFLPSFVVKLMPVADLAPTWTLAVLYVTRSQQAHPADEDSALHDLSSSRD